MSKHYSLFRTKGEYYLTQTNKDDMFLVVHHYYPNGKEKLPSTEIVGTLRLDQIKILGTPNCLECKSFMLVDGRNITMRMDLDLFVKNEQLERLLTYLKK